MAINSSARRVRRIAAAAVVACTAGLSFSASAGVMPIGGWTAWAVGPAGTAASVSPGGDISFSVTTGAPGGGFNWSNDFAGNYATAGTNTQTAGKAFYSTDAMNGRFVGELGSLSFTCQVFCVDNLGPGGPYVNVFVVDPTNAANKAILLVTYTGVGNFHNSFDFDTVSYIVNETTNAAWLSNGATLPFSSVKGLRIGAGAYNGMIQPVGGFSGAAADDGLLLAWGNRSGNLNGGPWPDVKIGNLTVTEIPVPGTLALAGLALAGLASVRRRSAAA